MRFRGDGTMEPPRVGMHGATGRAQPEPTTWTDDEGNRRRPGSQPDRSACSQFGTTSLAWTIAREARDPFSTGQTYQR